MSAAEKTITPYPLAVIRGEKLLNPLRLIQYVAERIGRKLRSGTVFKRTS
ncbi:hypothetical protein KBB12_01955 [Candidatus Woesebacteria bacterium]|nr:hypothetical protein [Candidatus Woesebacteria bacterium]